ncbi:MAG: transketolase family protein [Coriobacteriia bacterium]|nr:transketolase family protein [Coriobacteriia bacterium]
MAKATREAFGETLIAMTDEGLDIVAVDADLAGSTTLAKFGAAYPERFFEVGIAEQNMMGVAAGLSLTGKIAYTGSFAVFATGRAYDQIRNTIAYAQLNVKICPTHSGISVGPDGGSHQMLEDISLMRTLPGMRVLVPADYQSARAAIRLAAEIDGPVYVRLGRAKVPELYDEGLDFKLGGSHVLRTGSDISLVACGIMVNQALLVADELKAQGISAEVIDAYSISPFDEKTLLASAQKTNRVVTLEEHSIYGGLGSTVAEVLSEKYPCQLKRFGMDREFGTSGDLEELLVHFKLDVPSIVQACGSLF